MDWLKAIFGFLRDSDAERILAVDGWTASVGTGTAVGVGEVWHSGECLEFVTDFRLVDNVFWETEFLHSLTIEFLLTDNLNLDVLRNLLEVPLSLTITIDDHIARRVVARRFCD